MNFDEQKLKRLDNIRLNDNQYENVKPYSKMKFKGHLLMAFFFRSSKIRKCQKDIVVNPSKTQASTKNQN